MKTKMEKEDDDEDPFAYVTTNCHVTSSQRSVLLTALLTRQDDHFPSSAASQTPYSIPVETTGIRMESPPQEEEEDEFLTPDDDSLPAVSSGEPAPVVADLGVMSKESTVVIEWGGERSGGERSSGDLDEFMVVERKVKKVFDKMPVGKKPRVMEDLQGSDSRCFVGNEVVDLGGDYIFDEMPMRKAVQIGNVGKKSRITEDLEPLEGQQAVDLGANQTSDEMPMRNANSDGPVGKKLKVSERLEGSEGSYVDTEAVDLGGDQMFDDRSMRNQKKKMDMRESTSISIETVNLDDDSGLRVKKRKSTMGLDENISTQVVDLDEDDMCRNREAEKGPNENISTLVVDLDENETCGDLPMRNGEAKTGRMENSSSDVDWDEDVLYGDLTNRNLVGENGTNKGGDVRRVAEKSVEEIGKRKCVAPKDGGNREKDKGNGGWRELYDTLSQREQEMVKALNKVGEPCRDDNSGSTEKGFEEIDKLNRMGPENDVGGSSKPCGDERYRDGIRGSVTKNTDFQKGDNICQKGKRVAEVRKLPSSLDMLVETALGERGTSHIERTKRNVDKNRYRNDKSKPVGRTSRGSSRELPSSISGQTKNDQIMKNLLDGLGLITIEEKEKADDGSDEEINFLETAMNRGMVFPRPRWWPEEGFDDE